MNKNKSLHKEILLKTISVLRVCLLIACIAYAACRAILIVQLGLETNDWFSASMMNEYAIMAGVVIAFIVLFGFKDLIHRYLKMV